MEKQRRNIPTYASVEQIVQEEPDPEFHNKLRQVLQSWASKGRKIAIYENADLGHPDQGLRTYVTYGSSEAQLETPTPPERLPDIGNKINWRYRLIGVFPNEKND